LTLSGTAHYGIGIGIEWGDILIPTIAEKWYQDGVTEGIEQGIEQGVEKGIEEGKIEAALNMIAKGMTNADIRAITAPKGI
jgi:predicted transposase/invertase (TIGR01784 family)